MHGTVWTAAGRGGTPWLEYDSAAEWCASRGLKGAIGDPLPNLMSAEAHNLINDDPEAFERRVRECAYARAMESHDWQRLESEAFQVGE